MVRLSETFRLEACGFLLLFLADLFVFDLLRCSFCLLLFKFISRPLADPKQVAVKRKTDSQSKGLKVPVSTRQLLAHGHKRNIPSVQAVAISDSVVRLAIGKHAYSLSSDDD